MRLEIRRHRRALTGREADRVFRGCFLVAIGAGYCAIAASALGSPPRLGPSAQQPIHLRYRPPLIGRRAFSCTARATPSWIISPRMPRLSTDSTRS
jgi:hypothetical protein